MPPSDSAEPDLADRLAVGDAVTAMLHAIDARNWARVRAALADTVRVDYASLSGEPAAEAAADALVATWRAMLPGFDGTAHLTGPFVAAVLGDRADARCAVTATHRIGPVQGGATWVVTGHYEVALTRARSSPPTPEVPAWRITALTLRTAAVGGDLGLPEQARARVAARDAAGQAR